MSKTSRRVNPLQPVFGERQSFEEGRCDPERMNGRTDIVKKTRRGQFCRARSAAYGVARFQDTNRMPGAGNFYGRSKPVWARSDDDCIELHRLIVYARPAQARAMPIAPANHARWVVMVHSCTLSQRA